MSGEWFTETLYTDYRQSLRISKVLHRERTVYQDLMIFENPCFGRVLALDGIVQTTEGDEFAYHEMLVHVPILAHGNAKRVAIIGGGDGGALEEVLKHDVERVAMVELDPAVVELSRRYLPSICGDAFDDPRAEVIFADGAAFMREADETFDVIVVDSTDPVGPSVALFEQEFYADCRARLGEAGVLVTQSGVTFMQEDEARDTYRRMKPLFADAWLYLTQVPTYGAGFMTLGWGSLSAAPRKTPLAEIERRFRAAAIETRYYTPEIHVAAFGLPGYIRALMG
ncbi:MAG: polyamine aminopropyltransferase [Defluviicoccus sp.]|nr:polyamine aminopropyltransferase [Defluviicoccus sp.]